MITTNLANALLKYLFGQTKTVDYTDYTSSTDYAKCYIGLSTTTPKADGSNFTEPNPDSTGYSRQQICIGKSADTITWTNFMTIPGETTDKAGKIINGIISNTKEITFNESKSESPYTVTYFGIFHEEAANTGTPLYFHPLTKENETTHVHEPHSVTVDPGDVLLFKKDALSLDFTQD